MYFKKHLTHFSVSCLSDNINNLHIYVFKDTLNTFLCILLVR